MNFGSICSLVDLTFCPRVNQGIISHCYARNNDGPTGIMFQLHVLVVNLVTIVMVGVMIHNSHTKYQASDKNFMVLFFSMFLCTVICESLVITYIIPPTIQWLFDVFVSLHVGFLMATFTSLFAAGVVGLQGPGQNSLLVCKFLAGTSVVVGFVVAIITFHMTMDPAALISVYFIYPGILVLMYFVTQVYRVFKYSKDVLWPLGSLLLALGLFGFTQLGVFLIGPATCRNLGHMVDGVLYGSFGHLGCVMMVYRFWYSMTELDVEIFNDRVNQWEVPKEELKELMKEIQLQPASVPPQKPSLATRDPSPYISKQVDTQEKGYHGSYEEEVSEARHPYPPSNQMPLSSYSQNGDELSSSQKTLHLQQDLGPAPSRSRAPHGQYSNPYPSPQFQDRQLPYPTYSTPDDKDAATLRKNPLRVDVSQQPYDQILNDPVRKRSPVRPSRHL